MYQANINQKLLKIDQGKDGFYVNDEHLDADIQLLGEGKYHVLLGGKSYTAQLIHADNQTKTFQIGQERITVQLKNKTELLLESLGMNATASTTANDIKAPMPGKVVEVKVTEGEQIAKGQIVLILEAMKMENAIKATADCQVKTIKITSGENVEKGQILITLV